MQPSLLKIAIGALIATVATASQALVFAVNEGVTYRVGNDEVRAKYTAIAADLSKLLKQPVTIEPVGDYPSLRKGLAAKQYDLAMVHPAHLSIEAMKKSGYHLVAVTKGYTQYTANFLVKPDSTATKLTDLKQQSLGLPDEDSITSWMARATLRDALGGDMKSVKLVYTRYQDAVPFFVENNLTVSGSTASAGIVKAWQGKGGKVLGSSRPVPIKHIIASPGLTAAQQEQVKQYLLTLDSTDEGKKKLEPTKFQGFAPYAEAEMLDIGTWLGI